MSVQFFSQAGFLQFEISYGDPGANLDKVKNLLDELAPPENTILALPELWAYGFDYASADNLAAQTPSLLQALKGLAEDRGIILAGSLLEKKKGEGIFNTLYFVNSSGVVGRYRKQHLFAFWQEDNHFVPGGLFYPVSSSLGRIGGLVCYDLRFPEIAREQAFQGAQLIVVSAEWPMKRIDHWQTLLQARAIENQVFVIACNSSGTTGEHTLGGHSMVIGPDGAVLLSAGRNDEAGIVSLDEQDMATVRNRFCTAGERPRQVQDNKKIVDLPDLFTRIECIRKQKGRVAFTNGCFDILHSGHVAYLERARSAADCLVVGLNSDRSVKAIKGPERPVNSEQDRARILSALACIDYVVIFDEETPETLIRKLLPDVLVKGADWEEADIVGAQEVKAAGGKVVRIPFEHDVSTTGMITRIQSKE